MTRFFTRACAKIGRFFWSWGFLKFVLCAIALIILFYAEEDWRGARAWAATKAEWEAKGETFDYTKFIPPPVPDDQNLAALPLFKLEMVKNYDGSSYLVPVALQHAMRNDLTSIDLPPTGNWMGGQLPDMAKIRNVIATDYSIAFKDAKPPEDTLAQFDAIYPFLTDLRAAATTHPLFRFNLDYTISPPFSRPLGPLTQQIRLSRILTLHAILALDRHQSDLALKDIKINYEIASGVKRDPSLVGGLVAIGMNSITGAAIYDGLAQHEWSDAQLGEIEQTLGSINFLADFQFAMRSEVVQWTASLDWFENVAPRNVIRGLVMTASDLPLMTRFAPPWPSGWWDQNKSGQTTFVFCALASVDPKAHLVFPKRDSDLQHQIERECARWDAGAPWKILVNIGAGPVVRATQKYAYAQVWIDEARIACALERYRLAHGVYPGSLDALAPEYIDELPHDIMNGQPYHYRLRPDGSFLLYSVGWNQTDDGGKVDYKEGAPTQVDYLKGDWVWPTPK